MAAAKDKRRPSKRDAKKTKADKRRPSKAARKGMQAKTKAEDRQERKAKATKAKATKAKAAKEKQKKRKEASLKKQKQKRRAARVSRRNQTSAGSSGSGAVNTTQPAQQLADTKPAAEERKAAQQGVSETNPTPVQNDAAAVDDVAVAKPPIAGRRSPHQWTQWAERVVAVGAEPVDRSVVLIGRYARRSVLIWSHHQSRFAQSAAVGPQLIRSPVPGPAGRIVQL